MGEQKFKQIQYSLLGRLYNLGLNPSIHKLYPPVPYPVPRGTAGLSNLIKWDHSHSWRIPLLENFAATKKSSDMIVEVDCSKPESPDIFVTGHKIDGRVLYPATGYLMLAWKSLAKQLQRRFEEIPIVLEDVTLHRATVVPKEGTVKFTVGFLDVTGKFEVYEGDSVVASGRIYVSEDIDSNLEDEVKKNLLERNGLNNFTLDGKDFYKELRLRGYEYGPSFKGVLESTSNGAIGKLQWTGNWIVFIDTMLQVQTIGMENRLLYLPTSFQSIKIDPSKQPNPSVKTEIFVYSDKIINACTAGAVEIKGLKCSVAPRRRNRQSQTVLEEYKFVPNFDSQILSNEELSYFGEYNDVCSALVAKIMSVKGRDEFKVNSSAFITEDKIHEYLSKTKTTDFMPNILKDILKQVTETSDALEDIVKMKINEVGCALSTDTLHTPILNEMSLRASLDLVLENLPNNFDISILEVVTTNSIGSHFLNYFNQYNSSINVNYTVAHLNENLQTHNLNIPDGVKTVKINLNSSENHSANYNLVIAKDLSISNIDNGRTFKSALEMVRGTIKEGGFVILIERTKLTSAENFLYLTTNGNYTDKNEKYLETTFQGVGLYMVGKKSDGLFSTLYILRKISHILPAEVFPLVVKVENKNYDSWIEKLKKAISDQDSKKKEGRVWLIADSPVSGIVGLVNCLRREPSGKQIRCIFDSDIKPNSELNFTTSNSVYAEIIRQDLVMNVHRNGQWGTFRHLRLSMEEVTVPSEHVHLNVLTRGDLSSLRWIDSPLKFYERKNILKAPNLCHVYYAPLNFRDIMLATGKLPPDAIPGDLMSEDCILGLEFSGREDTPERRRVMGMVKAKGLATSVLVDPKFLWSVPPNWTLEEASTVPVAYTTAYYALITRGRLKRGESVLIHSGSGGVGQAAISIALSMDCKVFITVGSNEKKEYLKNRFPKLNDLCFSNSRDESFEYNIKRETDGEGVDIVLNSLSEEKLQASVRCLAKHGRFLEIGKFDLSKNNSLGMSAFLKNISFHGILLDALFENSDAINSIKTEIVELVSQGINNGTVRPLETTLFHWEETEDAFRFMASGKHIGKVVIQIRDEIPNNVKSLPLTIPSLPKSYCQPDKSFVIIGGLGGFGLELAGWLIERNAKKLVLTSRSGVRTGYQKLCLEKWRKKGIKVEVLTTESSSKLAVDTLIKESMKLGTIGGVFNLALVLKDALIENQTAADFLQVAQPKINVTEYLDEVTRTLCPDLEWFVVFSSVTCGRGNAGQSNYGFANSAMERICERRKSHGLSGLAIQWGVIGDVGVVQETLGDKSLVIGEFKAQRINSCLSTLDDFLQLEQNTSSNFCSAVLSCFVPAERKRSDSNEIGKKDLVQAVRRILGLKANVFVSDETTLVELGLDSLMSVEVKQTLERDYDLNLTSKEIRSITIKNLKEFGSVNANPIDLNIRTHSEDKSESNIGNLTVNGCNGNIEDGKVIEIPLPNQAIIPLNKIKSSRTIFMVHPIEGVCVQLKEISSYLKITSFGLQCMENSELCSIQDMASHYIKQIRSVQPDGPYFICGYSFGGLVAFEMAAEIQRDLGLRAVKTLTLLDGSPEFISIQIKRQSDLLNDIKVDGKNKALKLFVLQLNGNKSSEVIDKLSKCSTWDEQVTEALKIVAQTLHGTLNRQNLEKAFEVFYRNILAGYYYKSTSIFKGEVTLIKAEESVQMASHLPKDYGLSKIVQGNIDVHSIEGNHVSFLEGKSAQKVAEIINMQLKKCSI